jgi:tape measure domain-containing protein
MATERLDIVVTENGSRVAKRNIESVAGAATQTTTAVTALGNAMKILGAIAGAAVVTSLLSFADTATRVSNQLRLATTSTEEFLRVQKELYGVALQTNQPIDALASLYNKVSLSAGSLGLKQNELIDITKAVAQTIQLSGRSSAEASGALLQLSQALGGGVVRAEEFNSILEGMPILAQQVAASLNTSVAGLRNLVNAGQLSSKQLADAILEAKDRINADTSLIVTTFGQALTNLQTGITQFIATSPLISTVTTVLATGLNIVAQSIFLLQPALIALATILAVNYASVAVGAAITATTALITGIRALYAVILANPFAGLVRVLALVATGLLQIEAVRKQLANGFAILVKWIDQLISYFTGWNNVIRDTVAWLAKFIPSIDAGVPSLTKFAGAATEAAGGTGAAGAAAAGAVPPVQAVAGAALQAGQSFNFSAQGANNAAAAYRAAANAASQAASAVRSAASAGGGGGGGGGGPGGTAGKSYTSKVGLSSAELASSEAAIRQATASAVELKTQEAAYMYLANDRSLSSDVKNKAFSAAQQYAKDIAAGLGGNSIGKTQLQFMGLTDLIKKVEGAARKVRNEQSREMGGFNSYPTLGTSKLVGAFLRQVGAYGQLEFAGGGGFSGSPGFKTGGSFMVGGSGGPDSQAVSFRASPGEMVRISKKNPDGDPQTITINAQVIVPDVKDPEDFNRNQAYVEAIMAQTMRRAVARN